MKIKLYIFLLLLCLFGGTLSISAQQQPQLTEYELLAPIPLQGGEGGVTQKTTAADFIPGLFRLGIMLATGLAVLFIIWGGVQYMSTDAFTGKESAKETIWNAVMGLLLALSAWLIIATVNPNLMNFNLSIERFDIPENTNRPTASTTSSGAPSTPTTGGLTQQEAKTLLEAGGVRINGPVLLAGLNQRTIDEVINLKSACGNDCEVMVTSATGGTHASGVCSHGNGYKVDLRLNTTLTNFISQNYSSLPNRSDGARMYRAPSGALYAQEGNHWDIAVPCN